MIKVVTPPRGAYWVRVFEMKRRRSGDRALVSSVRAAGGRLGSDLRTLSTYLERRPIAVLVHERGVLEADERSELHMGGRCRVTDGSAE
jgi:hypothetical protein